MVCDTLLLPFYPQFFASEFAISNATLIGLFVANCCITVMLALPLWAKVAKKYNELTLWLVTQVVAAGFGLLCYQCMGVLDLLPTNVGAKGKLPTYIPICAAIRATN